MMPTAAAPSSTPSGATLPRLVRAGVLTTPYGRLKIASLYGPTVWLVMSLVVIPLLLHRPPRLGALWWIELVGHIPFVGLAIVASIAGAAPRRAGTG